MAAAKLAEERPYRSHLRPACFPCRNRRSRCQGKAAQSYKCLMCDFHGTDCVYPDSARGPRRAGRLAKKKQSQSHQACNALKSSTDADQVEEIAPETASINQPQGTLTEQLSSAETPFPSTTNASADGDHESHIIGPMLVPDAQRIAAYLHNNTAGNIRAAQRIGLSPKYAIAGEQGIMFSAVRRCPVGCTADRTVASLRCQIIEKLIEPFCTNVIELWVYEHDISDSIPRLLSSSSSSPLYWTYFEKVNDCLPVLDEALMKGQYESEKEKIPAALLACLFAHTMVFWKRSEKRHGQRCPDIRFIWNQANDALFSELYLSPRLSTIIAILLNISGRPLTSMIGNGMLLGSAISLAHSLGLNHDPSGMDISQAEIYLRTRIWWVIVIFDKWSSIAYGTPPHLVKCQYDVRVPQFNDASISATFVGLLTLTEILDTYLEHLYRLPKEQRSCCSLQSLNLEGRLTRWEDSLPNELRRAVLRGVGHFIPGSSNLRFAYLYVRFLGRKLGLDSERDDRTADVSSVEVLYFQARRAAEEIVLFVQELTEMALNDFWLPLIAFALSSTVAFLLRCAIEVENDSTGFASSISLKLAKDMIMALQSHRQRFRWDLGDICLAQYSEVVEKLRTVSTAPSDELPDLKQIWTLSMPGGDESFEILWDCFANAEDLYPGEFT
ncbi:MAG: hypothetical protein M1821_005702 [Bathelium mastoideum]|nr:MAG: hypothetical protein M1821_005702 [Bathelium mastoideum]